MEPLRAPPSCVAEKLITQDDGKYGFVPPLHVPVMSGATVTETPPADTLSFPSLTDSVTSKVPVSVYLCVGVLPVPVPPSPKFQLYVSGSLLASLASESNEKVVTPAIPTATG